VIKKPEHHFGIKEMSFWTCFRISIQYFQPDKPEKREKPEKPKKNQRCWNKFSM